MNWKIRTVVVSCLTVSTLICGAMSADAAVVGRAVSATGDLNLDVFNVDADGDTFPTHDHDGDGFNEGGINPPDHPTRPNENSFDQFGLGQRGTNFGDPSLDEYAFSLMDDSLSIAPAAGFADTAGIIKGGDLGNGVPFDDAPFFAATDTVNDVTTTQQQAIWDFDVSGATGALSLSIDFAAMGDFEDPEDVFLVETSFGGAFSPIFTHTVDEAGDLDYTLEDSVVTNLSDPLSINGTQLNNEFQTVTAAVPGSGDTLTVRFSALTNGGTEAFAFRNILVEDGGAAGVAGDYNGNGVVDAADYSTWLDALGGSTLLNESSSPGTVDQADYDFWKTRFGATVGTANGASVPEPCSAMLVLLAALQIGAIRRR